jgi:hypothetical protein
LKNSLHIVLVNIEGYIENSNKIKFQCKCHRLCQLNMFCRYSYMEYKNHYYYMFLVNMNLGIDFDTIS